MILSFPFRYARLKAMVDQMRILRRAIMPRTQEMMKYAMFSGKMNITAQNTPKDMMARVTTIKRSHKRKYLAIGNAFSAW